LQPAQLALTTVPINTAVELGGQTTFFCASDQNLLVWTFQPVGSETVYQIFSGIALNPDFAGSILQT